MTNGNNDDEDTRRDLTRIEDLSEFLHSEDSDVDDKFDSFETHTDSQTKTDVTTGMSLDDLDITAELESPPELPGALPETEVTFNQDEDDDEEDQTESLEGLSFTDESTIDFDLQNNSGSEEVSFGDSVDSTELDDAPFELSSDENNDFSFTSSESDEENIPAESFDESLDETSNETPYSMEEPTQPQEKFEEVKNFAQNFSYGQIQGGGNPPFSLIVRNLKYTEEAQDILIILREFGLVTDQNENDTIKSLELGSMLIPQISEYSAIVLSHKLRRFDCDIEVGLSDEVHPSKSGDTNPRGLVKKNSLRQNIVESYHKDESDTPIKDIIVSTTSSLEGYKIKKYIGVQTSFAVVDEEELERLKFVQQSVRANSMLEDYQTEDAGNFTSERAFKDYQQSFELLFTDLCDQLKVKAIKERANALLGLSYQISSLPFEKTNKGENCYQLTCTATLAVVVAE